MIEGWGRGGEGERGSTPGKGSRNLRDMLKEPKEAEHRSVGTKGPVRQDPESLGRCCSSPQEQWEPSEGF